MKSAFDRQQQRVVRESGEAPLDHEQLVRSALLDAERKNALIMADLLAISRASIDGYNEAVAEQIQDPASTMKRANMDEFHQAVAEQILDRTMVQANQDDLSQTPTAEIPASAVRTEAVARVVTRAEVGLAA